MQLKLCSENCLEGGFDGIRPQFHMLVQKCLKDCVHRKEHGVLLLAVIYRKILDGKSNTAFINRKSYVDCRDIVLMGK